ncbi:hypothetical protein [Humisphaera borealis]|uniref:Nucleotidyltransferase family protein n=1 Tax=Humisphaera borealis TaxID=2807512 RepID=A0A7M2X2S3_9BACT|nr:hypothetical protein [Humisphaera borealis]QOV92066.1 hypothetical protein IPV69_12215 [Humisphaera borealis]
MPETDIFLVLWRHGVPFTIIGGHAVNFHGYVRATEDADLVWLRTPDSEVRLLAALTELGARYYGTEKDPATGLEKDYAVSLPYIQSMQLMMLWTRDGFVDLFAYVPGLPDVPVQQLIDTSVENNGLRYVTRDWLFKLKRASGRTKDLLDIEQLSGD